MNSGGHMAIATGGMCVIADDACTPFRWCLYKISRDHSRGLSSENRLLMCATDLDLRYHPWRPWRSTFIVFWVRLKVLINRFYSSRVNSFEFRVKESRKSQQWSSRKRDEGSTVNNRHIRQTVSYPANTLSSLACIVVTVGARTKRNQTWFRSWHLGERPKKNFQKLQHQEKSKIRGKIGQTAEKHRENSRRNKNKLTKEENTPRKIDQNQCAETSRAHQQRRHLQNGSLKDNRQSRIQHQ